MANFTSPAQRDTLRRLRKTIGKNMAAIRQEQQRSIEECAQLFPCSVTTYQHYEAGKGRICLAGVVRLAAIFRKEPEWFILESDAFVTGFWHTLTTEPHPVV